MGEPIRVGMAEYAVARVPERLTCLALGSCVGIVLYDGRKRIGGVAHIMLPRRNEIKGERSPVRFADSAVGVVVADMERQGALRKRLQAKLFGGANMFSGILNDHSVNIGTRNALSAKEELVRQGIELVAEDLGGSSGRTIIFDTRDGSVLVRCVGKPERVL